MHSAIRFSITLTRPSTYLFYYLFTTSTSADTHLVRSCPYQDFVAQESNDIDASADGSSVPCVPGPEVGGLLTTTAEYAENQKRVHDGFVRSAAVMRYQAHCYERCHRMERAWGIAVIQTSRSRISKSREFKCRCSIYTRYKAAAVSRQTCRTNHES